MRYRTLRTPLTCFLVWVGSCYAAPIQVVTEVFEPFQIQHRDGSISGSATKMVRKAFDKANLAYRIDINEWTVSYNLALKTPNVCIYSIARIPEREKLFYWVGYISSIEAFLYSVAEKQIELAGIQDALKYNVAALQDDYSFLYLVNSGFEVNKNLFPVSSREKLISMLIRRSETVDLVMLTDSLLAQQFPAVNARSQIHKHTELGPLTLDFYLACNLNTERNVVEKLRVSMFELNQ